MVVAVIVAGTAAAGCGAEPIRGPQQVRTIVYDSTRSRFQLADRTLDTLEELTSLRGETTEFRTGARLVFDERDAGDIKTCADFAGSFVEDAGRRPSLSFIDNDGVWVPEDFDSLVMVSTYFNFELTREFFLLAGVVQSELAGTTTFYEPTLIAYDAGGGRTFGFDNAAYVPCISSFLLFAGARLQDIPLGANPGVAAHEYSHLMFDRVLYGSDGTATAEPTDLVPASLLWALNEGLADFFGAAVLGDPNFAARSLTRSEATTRNLVPGDVWRQSLEDLAVDPSFPDPYPLGSVWGAFFWEIGGALPEQQVGAATIAVQALRLLSERNAAVSFNTETMLNLVLNVAQAPADGGVTFQAVCAAVASRFAAFPLLASPCPG